MALPRSLRSLKCASISVFIIFAIGCLLAIKSLSKEETRTDEEYKRKQAGQREENLLKVNPKFKVVIDKHPPVQNQSMIHRPEQKNISGVNLGAKQARNKPVNRTHLKNISDLPRPSLNFHAFYYPWYGNPEFDRKYVHWNHQRLPHWDKKIRVKFSEDKHVPPGDIGASFYPELGCYSSQDPAVIENHMQQLRMAGIGVLVLSWYPPNRSDDAGFPSDDLVPGLLDACLKYGIKLAFHSEPYKNRTELTFLEDLKYIHKRYGSHPALYKYRHRDVTLPLVYLYDSYLTSSRSWSRILKKNGPLSIRGTSHDAFIIGLYVEQKHNNDILVGGFDGFYTYFAANKFSFGSRWTNWKFLANYAQRNNMLFIPSIGPGYDDTQVRPWNTRNTQQRRDGAYYQDAFKAAMNHTPPLISITSFNEWHEGTQIETAVPKPDQKSRYQDYLPHDPDYYLTLTRQMVDKYHSKR